MAIVYVEFEEWWKQYKKTLGIVDSDMFESFDRLKKWVALAAWLAAKDAARKSVQPKAPTP